MRFDCESGRLCVFSCGKKNKVKFDVCIDRSNLGVLVLPAEALLNFYHNQI